MVANDRSTDDWKHHAAPFLRVLGVGASVREARIILPLKGSARRVVSGFFDDAEKLVTAITAWRERAHCYVTLNPVNAEMLKHASNRILSNVQAARDADVVRREWLLIDVDPVRPDEMSGACATDSEHVAALKLRNVVSEAIKRELDVEAIELDSGNGGALLYRLADGADSHACKAALLALATRFDTSEAKLDRSVSNASRLTRIPGSVNVKREAAERPPRMARLETIPEHDLPLHLDRLLEWLSLPVHTGSEARGAQSFVIGVGSRNTRLMSVGGTLRRLGFDESALSLTLDAANRAICRPPLDRNEVQEIAASAATYPTRVELNSERREAVVCTVAAVVPAEVRWLWPGYMPLGKLVVVDGDPGLGKSLLALDLAARISRGDVMPNGAQGIAGDVMILSAEDGLADTIRPRLDAARATTERVHVIPAIRVKGEERAPELGIALDLQALERAIAERAARLLIIDPLNAFLGGGLNSNHDQDVRRALGPLARHGGTYWHDCARRAASQQSSRRSSPLPRRWIHWDRRRRPQCVSGREESGRAQRTRACADQEQSRRGSTIAAVPSHDKREPTLARMAWRGREHSRRARDPGRAQQLPATVCR